VADDAEVMVVVTAVWLQMYGLLFATSIMLYILVENPSAAPSKESDKARTGFNCLLPRLPLGLYRTKRKECKKS
jgi:hypothetical protein